MGKLLSGIRIQESGISYQVSEIRCQESGFRCQVSGFRCQESGFSYQVSGIRFQVSAFRACFLKSSVSLWAPVRRRFRKKRSKRSDFFSFRNRDDDRSKNKCRREKYHENQCKQWQITCSPLNVKNKPLPLSSFLIKAVSCHLTPTVQHWSCETPGCRRP